MNNEQQAMAQNTPAHFETGPAHYSTNHRAEGVPDVCADIQIKRGLNMVGEIKTGYTGQTTLDVFVPSWRKRSQRV